MSHATQLRLASVAEAFQAAQKYVGALDVDLLNAWLAAELGSATALDTPQPHGGLLSQALAPANILHVVSGNTPHAAFQSLLRGLVVGSNNWIKLPSAGLPEFESFLATLPAPLARLVECSHTLPDCWLTAAEVVVVFGGDAAITALRARLPATTRLIAHGHKLSVGVVFETSGEAATLAAADISQFDQQGCLSLQAIYVAGSQLQARTFAAALAEAMRAYAARDPRGVLSASEAGAIRNARELARYQAANHTGVELWESNGDTSWTVVYDPEPQLRPGPLNRFVRVHPLPGQLEQLGAECRFLSTLAIHPFTSDHASQLASLPATRFCPLGRTQQPSLFWHHDGLPTLASLVRWRDLG